MKIYHIEPDSLNFVVKISNNNDSDLHTHDFFEFIIIQSGAIEHTAEYTKTTLKQGDIVLLSPGVAHTYHSNDLSSHYDVLIRPSFLKEVCDFLDPNIYDFYIRNRTMNKNISINSLSALEQQFYNWQETIDIKTKKILEKIITSFLICAFLPERTENQDKSSFRENCLNIINQYYSLPNAISLIHSELGYNEIYLCKKFKQCFGCTLVEYVNNLRLTYAAYLFQSMNCTVTECANHIGLNSLPYFNKIFKEKYGMTPSQYRKQFNSKA